MDLSAIVEYCDGPLDAVSVINGIPECLRTSIVYKNEPATVIYHMSNFIVEIFRYDRGGCIAIMSSNFLGATFYLPRNNDFADFRFDSRSNILSCNDIKRRVRFSCKEHLIETAEKFLD